MKNLTRNLLIALGITVISTLFLTPVAFAAPGDYVATVNFSMQCDSGIGVGLTYDGQYLWYSCYASDFDLFRADPNTGIVDRSYDIVPDGGLGALSYDLTRNVIWAGEGSGGPGVEPIYKIDLNAVQEVVSVSYPAFDIGAWVRSPGCTLDDGLAFDANVLVDPTDDVFYYSNDCGQPQIIEMFDINGLPLPSFPWGGAGGYNSGLTVGGQLLYQGSDGASHVWIVDKVSKAAVYDFPTNVVVGDPNFRDEDLACDTNTFAGAGLHVMWSKEAYSPMRAHAFEIQFGSCGAGGAPPDDFVIPEYPLGTIVGLITSMVAMVVFVKSRRLHVKTP